MPQGLFLKIKELTNHAGFRKYFKNTGWMFLGRFFTLAISFFVGVYIARYLGPANYGLLNYVISFVGLFGFLSSLGIDSIISREIIKDHNKKEEIIGTGFYIKIFGSILAIISIFIVSILTTKDLFTLILIWIFSLNFIPQAFNIIEIYFQSQVLSKKVVTAQIISNIIAALLKIICIFLGKGIFWIIIIYILETSIFAIILLFSFKKFGNYISKWKFNKKIAKQTLVDSWPLMLSTVAINIYMKIDQIIIKNILGDGSSGIYAVAVKISEIWYFIPMLICISLFPAITKSIAINNNLFEDRMKKLYFLMFWLSLIITTITTILADPIIKKLFGNAYLESIPILKIYIWSTIIVFLSVAIGQYVISHNLTKIYFFYTALGAIINIILNIILVPKIGMSGSAIATLISYTIATFGIFISKKSRKHGLLLLKSIIYYK
jgi:O-antigen/teichoic acid export membrane protein